MRPASSAYDRGIQQSHHRAQPIVERIEGGELVSYEDMDLHVDDAAWADLLRGRVEEVPGEGYRLRT